MKIHPSPPRGAGAATVSIHVHDLAQLFNSFDPSPFWDRDLDRDAARFIEEEFADRSSAAVWHLHVHAAQGEARTADLQEAIERYYGRLANGTRRELREHLWLGQLALLGGIVIFLASMGAREVLQGMMRVVPRMLDEGLIVLAWIALWRPAETLGFEWVPLRRRRRIYERLAAIRVSVRSASASTYKPNETRQRTGSSGHARRPSIRDAGRAEGETS